MKPSKQSGRGQDVYRCRKNHSGGTCASPANIGHDALESWVIEQALSHHDVAYHDLGRALDLDGLAAAVSEAEAELMAFLERMSASAVPDLFNDGVAQREATVTQARSELAHARATASHAAIPMVFTLREMWDEMTPHERREALAAMIDFVVVTAGRGPVENRAAIVWRGQADQLDLPRQGVAMPVSPFAWPLGETSDRPEATSTAAPRS